jgi:hypothetical protein
VAEAPDGTLYAATGNRGRVYRIGRDGKSSLLWTAEQPEVFAIAVGHDGALYAGSSPDGKVYRIRNGKPRNISRRTRATSGRCRGARWRALRRHRRPGQGLPRGRPRQRRAVLRYRPIARDRNGDGWKGRLLAGTEPNGILYRISAKDKAFVLYNASLPEIRAIVPMPDGSVYAAALGGSVAKRAQAANAGRPEPGRQPAGNRGSTSITVEAQATGRAAKSSRPPPRSPQQPQTPAAAPQVSTQFTPAVDLSNVEKSAVYRINPDNTVETLWSSKEENVYDVLALEKQVLFSTDQDGRIYGLAPDRRVTLVTQTNEGETTRLLPSDHSVLAATANMGRILRLGDTPGASGEYEAPCTIPAPPRAGAA